MPVATGVFTVDTAGDFLWLDLEFAPKALVLWTTLLAPGDDIEDGARRVMSFGFASIEGGEFGCYMEAHPHPSLPTVWLDSTRIHSNEVVVGLLTVDTWLEYGVRFNSLDSGPFEIHYMAFGGDSVRSFVSTFGIPNSGASMSVTDVPFDMTETGAKCVLLATASLGGLSQTGWGAQSIGAVAGEGLEQWFSYNWTAQQGSTQGGYTEAGSCIRMFDAGVGASAGQASVDAWTASGFDVGISESPAGPGDTQVLYLVVFSDHPDAFAQAGSFGEGGADETVTTPDTPDAVLLTSAVYSVEEDDQVQMNVGGADADSQTSATALSYGGTTRTLVEQSETKHLHTFKPFAPDYEVDAVVSAFNPTDFVEDFTVVSDGMGVGAPAWGYLAVKTDPDLLSMLPMGGT